MNFGSRAPQQTLANLGGMDLPAANRPEIHVDKLRLGIVADTAAVQAERGVAQASGGNAGNANVDGLAEHVLAVLRDPDRRAAQKFVAPRRAITANDVNLGAGMADRGSQIAEQIEKARIEIGDVTGAVIAQEMVEFVHGIGEIRIPLAINDIDALIGVQVIEQQAMLRHWNAGSGCHTHRKNQRANQEKRKRKKTAWKHLKILA